MKKLVFIILIILCIGNTILSNVAQPGIWRSGGTGTFSLVYVEDSLHFRKIQMLKELVTVKIYDGYAAVKGKYWMYNGTEDTVNIKAGYPVNGIFESEQGYDRLDIYFDDLYKLNAKVNNKSIALSKELVNNPDKYRDSSKWYIWNTSFTPLDTTLIEVYFLVKTSESTLLEGYSSRELNAFVYLLESGSSWKQPIIKGRIQIYLDDGLSINDLRGVRPDTIFKWSEENNLLVGNFKNLTPNENDNIIITFDSAVQNFDFSKVIEDYISIFDNLDLLEKKSLGIQADNFQEIEFENPFKTGLIQLNPMVIIILGPIILLIGIISIIQISRR